MAGLPSKKMSKDFAVVISSLGANYDFRKTKSTLWQNAIADGLTQPHETGIGVSVDEFGRLSQAKRIYTAGIPTAGYRMIHDGLCGPALVSVKRIQHSIETASRSIMYQIRNAY